MSKRKAFIIITILIIAGAIAISVLLSGCFKQEAPMPGQGVSITALATTSADERHPVWSPDGSKIFFVLDGWICVCNPDGSNMERLIEKEANSVFCPDMESMFYFQTIDAYYIFDIARNSLKEPEELKHKTPTYIEVGITGDIANLVVMFNSGSQPAPFGLDIYVDLGNETVIKVDRIEEAKVPVGAEKVWRAYVIDIGSKNREKIAELTFEEMDYFWDRHGTGLLPYGMFSWSSDRTKIFCLKYEPTGYTWVWMEGEKIWKRYKAGTEPTIPTIDAPWGTEELAYEEVEKSACVWDLKDNELKYISHLSYGFFGVPMKGEVVWSPDGKYVALPCGEFSEAGASEQIVVVNMESGETKRLTSLAGVNAWPTWSPDGKKIMYWHAPLKYWWSAPIPLNTDIWVMDADGGNKKQLTDGTESNEEGVWSPDGSKIAYDSWHDGLHCKSEIWMMNADGNGKKLLVKNIDGGVSALEWSPDGSKIAFAVFPTGKDRYDSDIYMINVPSGE